MLQADPLQHLIGAPPLLLDRRAEHAQREADVLEHRLGRHQLEVLEDEADGAAIRLHLAPRHAHEIAAVDDGDAFGRPLLQQQQAQQRALARAARAGQKHELALADREREIAQRVQATAVCLAEPVGFDHAAGYCKGCAQIPSSFLSSSVTIFGFAFPFDAFITWPTRKPKALLRPFLICATASGFAAIASRTMPMSASVSPICASPSAAIDIVGRTAAVEHLREDVLGHRVADGAAIDGLHESGQRRRRQRHLLDVDGALLQGAQQLAHDPVAGGLGVSRLARRPARSNRRARASR